jgi:hypothetical protein
MKWAVLVLALAFSFKNIFFPVGPPEIIDPLKLLAITENFCTLHLLHLASMKQSASSIKQALQPRLKPQAKYFRSATKPLMF